MINDIVLGIGVVMSLVGIIMFFARTTHADRKILQALEDAELDKACSHALAHQFAAGVTAQQAHDGFHRLAGQQAYPPVDCEGCGARLGWNERKCHYCRRER